jgi:hypothetical protein
MSTITFRKAVRTNTTTLIALAGPSGGGKTYSALRLARGLVGQAGKVAMIDTEAGRSLHYADQFEFDHHDMHPPFSPDAYKDAIIAAEKAGYGAIVVDSMSHEWAGDGGCQDIHDDDHKSMGGQDSTSVLAWRNAKTLHKKMISRFLQSRSHLIFCLRSEEKIKFTRHPTTGKIQIEPAGWMPICEKNFMYEMTVSFMLLDAKPGVGKPIKLQEQHKPFFRLDSFIDEDAGQRLAQWALGGVKPSTSPSPATNGQETLSEGEKAFREGLFIDQDPTEPYKGRLQSCERSKQAITDTYNAIPDTIRQNCFQEFQKQLRSLDQKAAKA